MICVAFYYLFPYILTVKHHTKPNSLYAKKLGNKPVSDSYSDNAMDNGKNMFIHVHYVNN